MIFSLGLKPSMKYHQSPRKISSLTVDILPSHPLGSVNNNWRTFQGNDYNQHKGRTIKFFEGRVGQYQKKIRALKKYGEKISCTNKQILKKSSKLFKLAVVKS